MNTSLVNYDSEDEQGSQMTGAQDGYSVPSPQIAGIYEGLQEEAYYLIASRAKERG